MTRLLFSLLPISIFATSCATSIVPPSPTAPIYEARKIELGGVKQSVIIRGDDRSNPILMFVHGGPGFSELPTYERNADLERDFVVVQWDQRGAGKSYRPGIPKKSMAVAQFVADTHQLTDIVCRRLEKKKALLVGFSFGSLIGLQAVAESPERYHGYVGLSHFVTILESEEILDIEGRARAARKSETEILAKLEKIGPPPYKNHPQERVVNALIKNLVIEDTKNPFPASEYIGSALWS
ncbi:alpha/beta hydrolase, partial [Verrucomicrobiales bacterium]|nr:alpha/beta hydrolase [Verrucomicrobiales bacterium]